MDGIQDQFSLNQESILQMRGDVEVKRWREWGKVEKGRRERGRRRKKVEKFSTLSFYQHSENASCSAASREGRYLGRILFHGMGESIAKVAIQ